MILVVQLANKQTVSNIEGEHSLSFSNVTAPEHFLGFGLGLRTDHFQDVIDNKPDIDWFEVVSENFMVDGGKPKHYLHTIREHYPMVMHGVSLSIGSTDPLNTDYLRKLKVLANELQPEWISDHLCWTGTQGKNSHDLLPLPYNEEALKHICERVEQVQDFLGRPILLENLSSYVTYKDSEITEWQFFNEVARRSGCEILLDINNIYVSARNHDFNPEDYLNGISKEKVKQFHLAGHNDYGDYVIDTHDHPVADPVWQLYETALQRFGWISTMIERDDNIPPLVELLAEIDKAREIAVNTLGILPK